MVHVDYPNEDEELDIIHRTTTGREADVSPVLDADQVMDIQKLVRDVPVPDHVARYAIRLVRATRHPGNGQEDHRPQVLQQYVSWGAGPRATQSLVLAGKARAILQGRSHVTVADVSAIAHPVMRHRLICNFNAEADGVTTDVLIDRLLQAVQPDQADDDMRNQMASVIRS